MVAPATMPQITSVLHCDKAMVQLSETSEFVCNWYEQKWELKTFAREIAVILMTF